MEIELKEKWHQIFNEQLPLINQDSSGLELELSTEQIHHLNMNLKTANKILIRIKENKCRDLPRLFHILSRVNWREFLSHERVEFNIVSNKSRLINTSKIKSTASEALKKYFLGQGFSDKQKELTSHMPAYEIYITLENDSMKVSLNISSSPLYERGDKRYKGKAPIRSSLASSMWLILRQHIKDSEYNVIDPMCGSGTLLKELINYNKTNKDRYYHSSNYELNDRSYNIENLIRYGNIKGIDIDHQVISKLKDDETIEFINQDVFDYSFEGLIKPVILISNPPYGKRIKIDNPQHFYNRLVMKLLTTPKGSIIAILAPRNIKIKSNKIYPIFNCGIWLNLHILFV